MGTPGSRIGAMPLEARSAIVVGILLVIEQGALSGGNFLSVILVARHISPADFGIFAAMQSALWLAQAIYSALVLEPMTVLAPTDYHGNQRRYFRMLLSGHALCSFAVAIACAPLLWVMTRGAGRESVATVAIFLVSVPTILWLWLARRASQIEYRPRLTALAGICYAAAILSLIEALAFFRLLDHATAFVALALASVVAALPMTVAVIGRQSEERGALQWKNLLARHWQFARWEVIAALCYNVANQIPVFVLAATGRLESAGALRAIQGLVSPVYLLMAPAVALVIPKAAHHLRLGDTRRAADTARYLALAMTAVAVAFAIAVGVFSTPIEYLAYGGKYRDAGWVIMPLALSAVITAPTIGHFVLMRAACWPQCTAIITSATLVVAVLTLPLIYVFGLSGAAAVAVATSGAGSAATVLAFHYFRRRWKWASA
jgi:O-antigen/teichoic acid export membrane protein